MLLACGYSDWCSSFHHRNLVRDYASLGAEEQKAVAEAYMALQRLTGTPMRFLDGRGHTRSE